jgi:hypothetical protein
MADPTVPLFIFVWLSDNRRFVLLILILALVLLLFVTIVVDWVSRRHSVAGEAQPSETVFRVALDHVGPITRADPCGFRSASRAPILTADIDRQLTRESRTHANSPWRDSAMSSDLTEIGQEAIAAVSRGVDDGASLVKCQLLASAFYEALRHELRQADATQRGTLLGVTRQCHRAAAANISPVQALHELKRAVDLLQPVIPAPEALEPVPRSRPVLRVI